MELTLKLIQTYICILAVHFLIILFDKYIYENSTLYFITNEISLNDKKNRQWYLLHAIINTIIVILTLDDTILTLTDPLDSTLSDFSLYPIFYAITLHLHHIIISLKYMTVIDWCHHLISCMFVGFLTLHFIKGRIINYTLFFLCGLPGGIDYYLLAMKKYGLIHKKTEKYINVYLNMWIRLPGILYGCFIGWFEIMYNDNNYNILLSLLIIILNAFNSIYFATRVVKNYGEYLEKQKH